MTEPILRVVCIEKGEEVERSIYPFVFTRENIQKFWDNARKYPQIFGKTMMDDMGEFLNMFFYIDHNGLWQTNNLFFVVDDFVGIIAVTNIYHPEDALIHFTFFDGRLKGRETLLQEMIRYGFDVYGFHRLTAEIPCYASSAVLKFVSDKLQLVLEGRRRKSVVWKGERFDVLLYGVIPEDIKKWDSQRHKQLVVEQQVQ